MKEFITVLFRRKWYAIVFFVFMVAIPMGLAYILPPKYEAKATLLLTPGREKKPFLPDEKDSRASFMQVSMEDVGSEVELLESYPVLSVAVDKNHLDRDIPPTKDEYLKYVAYYTFKWINDSMIKIGLKSYVPPREDAIARLGKKLNVEFIKRTNIISIKWRGSSPELARNVVNSVVDAYLDHHIKVYGNSSALEAIKQQMDDSYKRLTGMENKLTSYSSKNSISDIGNEHKVILSKLSESESKVKILNNLAKKDVATGELGNISGDPAFLDLSSRLTDAELRRIELLSKFGQEDRKVQAVNKEIEEIKGFISQRLKYNLATWKALALSYREQLNHLDQANVVISRIKRDVDNLTQEYLLNKEKYNEILISNNMDKALISSVKVIEYATLSSGPVFPKKMIILVVSLFFGTFGGIVYAFAFDKFSGRLMSVQEVESIVNIPVLASVKQYGRHSSKEGTALKANISKDLVPVREKLLREAPEQPVSVLLASPSHRAGTSFLSENLAQLLSRDAATSAIYVSIHDGKWLHKDDGPDVNKVLTSLQSLSDFITRKKDDNFDRMNIHIGHEEIDSIEMKAHKLVEALKNRYGYVVLDLPSPRSGMSYLKFVPYVDHVFIVVAYNISSRFPLLRMADMIKQHQGRITGCIFNRRRDVIPAFIYNRLF